MKMISFKYQRYGLDCRLRSKNVINSCFHWFILHLEGRLFIIFQKLKIHTYSQNVFYILHAFSRHLGIYKLFHGHDTSLLIHVENMKTTIEWSVSQESKQHASLLTYLSFINEFQKKQLKFDIFHVFYNFCMNSRHYFTRYNTQNYLVKLNLLYFCFYP